MISEDVDSNKQRAAIVRQGIMVMFAWYEEIVKENMRYVSRQIVVSDFLKSSEIRASPPVGLDMETTIRIIGLQFKRKCLFLKLSFVYHYIFFVDFFTSMNISYIKTDCLVLLSPY